MTDLSKTGHVEGVGVNEVVGAARADPEGMVLTLTRSYVGSVWSDVMQLHVAESQFACVLAFRNVVTRYQFALSLVALSAVAGAVQALVLRARRPAVYERL
ncbi:hypothetical protein ACIPJK_35110 [Streptomyces roseus]|uniref:hypothetical protein n=1 Tax=Streptomyces roseus TaxID=66430 RepID=UPI003828939C